MARSAPRGLFAVVAAGAVLACSLVVETEELDAGCDDRRKYCAGSCVRVDDPSYGCTPTQCEPCQQNRFGEFFGDRLVPRCDDGVCVVDTCSFGYGCADCSARILTDAENCGSCGHDCGAGRTCSRGRCVGEDGAGGAGGAGGGS